jgi:repressor LexA
MQILTTRQREVLLMIKRYIKEHNVSPTIEEIAEALKVSSTRTVTQYLEALERKGYIHKIKHKKRNIMVTDQENPSYGETVTLPVVGAAACGSLNVYAEESFNEFIQVSKHFLSGRSVNELMVIRAVGYSMQDAGIEDGDLVIIEFTENIKDGDIVAAVIDGMAVIKRISFTANAVILDPVTSIGSYTQIVMRRDFKVLGKVLHVIKAVKHDDVEFVPISAN